MGTLPWRVAWLRSVCSSQGSALADLLTGRPRRTTVAAPFGPWLLGIVAVGLVAYGLFALVEARYCRMIVC